MGMRRPWPRRPRAEAPERQGSSGASPAVADFPWEHGSDAGDPGGASDEGYRYVPEVFAFTPVTMRQHPHEGPGRRTPEQPGRADANVAGAAPRPEPNRPSGHDTHEGHDMTLDNTITQLLAIEGASGAAIVDGASGMALAQGGHPGFDLSVAAAGNSNVVRAKIKTMTDLGLDSRIEDILITLDGQYHLINVLSGRGADGLFVYLVLDRTSGNLALARHKLANIAKDIAV